MRLLEKDKTERGLCLTPKKQNAVTFKAKETVGSKARSANKRVAKNGWRRKQGSWFVRGERERGRRRKRDAGAVGDLVELLKTRRLSDRNMKTKREKRL